MTDYRQQEELEQERMTRTLAVLQTIFDAGFKDESIYLSIELGLETQFTKDIHAHIRANYQ